MGIEFNQNEIDCAHYISKSSIDKNENKKARSIIIKFRSWESTAFSKVRPRNHLDRQKKPSSSFNVSLDITKHRYNLLTNARELVSNNPLVLYVFSVINCSLVLKFNDNTFHCFSSEY